MKRRSDWQPLTFEKIKTISLHERKSKVDRSQFATPIKKGASIKGFLQSLPKTLAAAELNEVASLIVEAVKGGKTVLLGMGGHPIKVGLNPIIIDLMKRGVITALALNGAGIVHDVEVALIGKTSEEVAEGLAEGAFGVTAETAEFINSALRCGHTEGLGFGGAIGKALAEGKAPYRDDSICAAAFRLGLPVTVHVAIGTDVVHIHPSTDGGLVGEMSYRDFKLFTALVAALEGGIYINLGSAVILPEVFLKALSAVRNLGHRVYTFTTLNMDFIQHYRPTQNVVSRPTAKGGRGFAITGHHEIMFPLLAAAIIAGLQDS